MTQMVYFVTKNTVVMLFKTKKISERNQDFCRNSNIVVLTPLLRAMLIYTYKPSFLFVRHIHTVQTQIRCHRMIGVSPVCLQNACQKVYSNFIKNQTYHPTTLKMEMYWSKL